MKWSTARIPMCETVPAQAEEGLDPLLERVRACRLCAGRLPVEPRPVLVARSSARLLIVGQAPGRKVHEAGIPFHDASGVRLREWLGLSNAEFRDDTRVAFLPMGFCYPGTGRGGDLPPRPECAATWRAELLAHLPHIRLTLLVGAHAIAWHLPDAPRSVARTVADWRRLGPQVLALPHPSPRNTRWLRERPWFTAEVLPELRRRVAEVMGRGAAGLAT